LDNETGRYLADKGYPALHISPTLIESIIGERIWATLELVPSEWKTARALGNRYGVSSQKIETDLERIVREKPDLQNDIGVFIDTKNRMYTFYSPRIIGVWESRRKKLETAPEGYMTIEDMAESLEIYWSPLNKRIKTLLRENPELNIGERVYLSKKGHRARYYSPEVYKKIREELEEETLGWKTTKKLSEELGVTQAKIYSEVDRLVKKDPGFKKEIKRYLDAGRTQIHYSPRAERVLREKINGAPAGYETINSLSGKLGFSQGGIRQKIDKVLNKYPELDSEVKKFPGKTGKAVNYFSPRIIEKVREEIENVPHGWQNVRLLSKKFKVSPDKIKLEIRKILQENPELETETRDFLGASKRVHTHYSPKIIKALEERFGNFKKAPQSFKSIKEWAEELGISETTVKRKVDKLTKNKPELSSEAGMFVGPKGYKQMCYSPPK
jgi:predicted transcriptional regulator/AraC-like DNA-binding protein